MNLGSSYIFFGGYLSAYDFTEYTVIIRFTQPFFSCRPVLYCSIFSFFAFSYARGHLIRILIWPLDF